MIEFDRIVERIFVGTCPADRVDVEHLRETGFSALLSLQSDADLAAAGIVWPEMKQLYIDNYIAACRIPIIDFDDDDLLTKIRAAADKLEQLVNEYGHIYVHCTAGMQRSPATVIGYLAWNRRLGLNRAIDLVMAARKCDPPVQVLRHADQIAANTCRAPRITPGNIG